MSLAYKLLVEQRKRQKRNGKGNVSKKDNVSKGNGNCDGNGKTIYVCHKCKAPIDLYETFWFLDKTYCVLCYVLLTM
jgi:hypothetical protein